MSHEKIYAQLAEFTRFTGTGNIIRSNMVMADIIREILSLLPDVKNYGDDPEEDDLSVVINDLESFLFKNGNIMDEDQEEIVFGEPEIDPTVETIDVMIASTEPQVDDTKDSDNAVETPEDEKKEVEPTVEIEAPSEEVSNETAAEPEEAAIPTTKATKKKTAK